MRCAFDAAKKRTKKLVPKMGRRQQPGQEAPSGQALSLAWQSAEGCALMIRMLVSVLHLPRLQHAHQTWC